MDREASRAFELVNEKFDAVLEKLDAVKTQVSEHEMEVVERFTKIELTLNFYNWIFRSSIITALGLLCKELYDYWHR